MIEAWNLSFIYSVLFWLGGYCKGQLEKKAMAGM